MISAASIFLAVYAALCTAYLLYKLDWAPMNSAKRIAGNPLLFMAVVFSAVLLLMGYLFRVLLFRLLVPLSVFDFAATASLCFIQLSEWQHPRWLQLVNRSPVMRYVFIVLLSLLIASVFMYTVLFFLSRIFLPPHVSGTA
jgi:hypothetical protein